MCFYYHTNGAYETVNLSLIFGAGMNFYMSSYGFSFRHVLWRLRDSIKDGISGWFLLLPSVLHNLFCWFLKLLIEWQEGNTPYKITCDTYRQRFVPKGSILEQLEEETNF